ncbi:MAG: ATP-dependent Clp protease adaptor ClpS [Bacteroidales bacterium]|nr:ATP-dependent Clp protease adaptor ClpS [Candidatus Colimorpha onthohippi]
MNQHQHQTATDSDAAVLEDHGCQLMLYNDDVHTFDYVIKALVDICRHTFEQAEQCAILVHCIGKCAVKTGSMEELMPMHTALLGKQLTSEIIK